MTEPKPRDSNLLLPDVHEILQLVRERESTRLVAHGDWITDHQDVFQPFRELCRQAGATDIYALDREVKTEKDFAEAVLAQEQTKNVLIKALEKRKFDPSLLRAVYEGLAEADDPSSADAIFVYGSPLNTRVDKAVELYKAGLAPKLVLSGKGPNWGAATDETEARRMASRAKELGVLERDMILEELSLTLPDNVKRTLDIFDQTGFHPKKIIIITTPHIMRRAYIEWMRFPVEPIQVVRVAPPSIDPTKSADKWHTNDEARHVVLNEYAKIFGEACISNLLAVERSAA